jgi:hypothetical protein
MKLIKFGVALLAITSILTGCASDRDKVQGTVSEYATKQEDIEGTVIAKRSTEDVKKSEDKKAEDQKSEEKKENK